MRRSLGPLLCELHAHTRWSDGELTVAELVDLHGGSGFDALCVTDHVVRTDDPWREEEGAAFSSIEEATFPLYLGRARGGACRPSSTAGRAPSMASLAFTRVSAVDVKTLPWSWYTDPAVLQLERERIFRRSWQYVGHTGEVSEPGSFAAAWVGDVPVVLVRDGEDTLRAFLNVCRHRGSIVCEGKGRRETLQCPYHAWTYGLDGRLITAPRGNKEGGIAKEELGLVQLQLDTWGPLVFVNPDPDAGPLEEFLDGIPERIADAGIDFEALRFLQRSESELDCNWKVSAENFLECYHCPTAHPGFSAVMDVSVDSYLLETSAGRMTQHGPPRAEPRGAYDPTGEVERGQFHLLFPGTVVNVMPGRPNFSIGPIVPRGPEKTYRFLDYWVAEDADQAWIDESLAFDAQVGAEDRMLIERVQAGMRAGLIEGGRLLPQSEQLIAHFQALVVDALA